MKLHRWTGADPGIRLVNGLQFLAWFEAHGFSRRNRNLRPGARVASNSGLAWTYVEHAKPAQLNAIALGERALHALENGFHCQFSFGFCNSGLVDHFVDDVELNHRRSPTTESLCFTKLLMLREI
jgi:hypothetical protein